MFALVHSPLVGPSTWRRVARALEARGAAALATDYGGVAGPDWYDGAADRICAAIAPRARPLVVLHSGAGAFAPGLADRLRNRMAGLVLVDAVTPYPGQRWIDVAPEALVRRLRTLAADDGRLPIWSSWFADGAIERLIGDPGSFSEFSAELPRVPFAFLEARAPDLPMTLAAPAAYLQLSDAYAAEAQAATARAGWRVRREPLHHLAMLTHPDRLARVLLDIAGELTPP